MSALVGAVLMHLDSCGLATHSDKGNFFKLYLVKDKSEVTSGGAPLNDLDEELNLRSREYLAIEWNDEAKPPDKLSKALEVVAACVAFRTSILGGTAKPVVASSGGLFSAFASSGSISGAAAEPVAAFSGGVFSLPASSSSIFRGTGSFFSAPASSSSILGGAAPTTSIFGSAATGGLFSAAAANSGSIFGGLNNAFAGAAMPLSIFSASTSTGGGLFGSTGGATVARLQAPDACPEATTNELSPESVELESPEKDMMTKEKIKPKLVFGSNTAGSTNGGGISESNGSVENIDIKLTDTFECPECL